MAILRQSQFQQLHEPDHPINISLENMILIMHKNNKKNLMHRAMYCFECSQDLRCKSNYESHLKILRNILEDMEPYRDAEDSM